MLAMLMTAIGDWVIQSHDRPAARVMLLLMLLALTTACSTLPTDVPASASTAFLDDQETSLGRVFGEPIRAHRGKSGFEILDTGRDALLVRLAAIAMAEQAIDLQYYIWNSDHAGRLMADRVLQAADRGVQVRLLLDDFGTGDKDAPLSAMDAHPNIQVRIYNPNANRSGLAKWLAFIGEFGRLNQRMHNKSFIVDGSVAIVGGRNIGDEYFDLGEELNFRDRDLLAVGPIVSEIAAGFDAYWNSGRSFPVSSIADGGPGKDELPARRAALRALVRTQPESAYALPENAADALGILENWRDGLVWAEADLLMDHVKALGDTESNRQKRVAQGLSKVAQETRREVLIESAYLVLGDPGLELVRDLQARGVTVRALTNSLASNDVTANHAAYARRRPAMLEEGIALYELRPDAASCRQLIETTTACGGGGLFGLHAKSIVFDRRRVFVGSFNLNQRSVYLNSELGVLVHSPELSRRIALSIEENMAPENSWRVTLDEQGEVRWTQDSQGVETYYRHEPETGVWRRLWSGFLALLPIEKYL
jgi:putative cardiolipin synthase